MNLSGANRHLPWRLACGALLMFGFGYLLVPLYRVYCNYTGFNGSTMRIEARQAQAKGVDTSRWVTVEFAANTAAGFPWEFHPEVPSLRVHPGQLVLARYQARNVGQAALVGQAVPSVTPGQAAPYFRKIECFCFSRQAIGPGEVRQLPVQFQVDPGLPADITTLTLSYTFFELPGNVITTAVSRPLSML